MGRKSIPLGLVLCAAAAAQGSGDAAFRQGYELYKAGNCPEAVGQLTQSKGTPRAYLLLGRCYLDMGDFAKAHTSLTQYLQAVPADEDAAILLARAEEAAGDTAHAATSLEALHKQLPGSLAVQDALGDAYARLGKSAEATGLYNAVLSVQPADLGALAGLARLALASSRWTVAAELYQKVLDHAPDNAAAEAGIGQAQLQLGNVPGAINHLQHALLLRPDDWALNKVLANCYVKIGKWPEAIRTLEYDSLAHPQDEEVTGWMVQAFTHTAETARAEQYYRAVLQRAAGNFTARLTLADLLYNSHRAKESKEQYILVLQAKPELFEISDRVGQIAEQENNLPEAIKYYADACKSPQATPAMKLRLAQLYFRTGDLEHARPALEAAMLVEPGNREIKMMLTQVAIKTNRPDDAVRYATELLPGDPNNLTLLRLLGEDALKRNRNAAAADYLEKALAVNAKDRDLRFELVGLYTNDASLDRLPRAFDLMNDYVSNNPDDYEGYLLLANLYRRKSDAANAYDYFTRGFAKMPANPPARMSWAYNSFGLLLFSEGKYEDALANQLKAVELNPADANSEYNLALTYLKLKRRDETNAARMKLMQMSAPDLVSALDEAIQRSRINQGK